MNDRELALFDLITYYTIGTLSLLFGANCLRIAYLAHKWLKEDAEFLEDDEVESKDEVESEDKDADE